jgi:hypothetical protein
MKRIKNSFSSYQDFTYENSHFVLVNLTRGAFTLWLYFFTSCPAEINCEIAMEKLKFSYSGYYVSMRELITKCYLIPTEKEDEWMFIPFPQLENKK